MGGTTLGRHAKPPAGSWKHTAARVAGTAATWAGWAVMWALIAAVALGTFAVAVIAAGLVQIWHRLGVHGRFIAAMVAAPFTAILADSLGILPGGNLAILVAAGSGVAVFGTWLRLVTWRGQRQWRQREHPAVVQGGGLEADVAELRTAMAEQALLSEAILAMVRDACDAAGYSAVSASDPTHPHLRLVQGDG